MFPALLFERMIRMDKFKGTFSSSVSYSVGDVVSFDGRCYRCIRAGSALTSDTRFWSPYSKDVSELLIMVQDAYEQPAGSLTLVSAAPESKSASGSKGEYYIDSGYLYVCVAKDTWKRATLSAWTAT